MIVLVPVSMFTVPYQVARGRPYSRLERRVLEAIASPQGVSTRAGATLNSLCETFHVHERLMVEAVVTLVGAGWVAVAGGREAAFVLTGEGQRACSTGKDPASVTVEPATPCTLIFDRTTGQLARRGEVPTVSAGEARIDLNPCTQSESAATRWTNPSFRNFCVPKRVAGYAVSVTLGLSPSDDMLRCALISRSRPLLGFRAPGIRHFHPRSWQ